MTTSAPGVHLVGSVCEAASAEDSFRKRCLVFPSRLRRILDGQAASRHYFIKWQDKVFGHNLAVLRKYDASFNSVPQPEFPTAEIDKTVTGMLPLKSSYADAAIELYAVFQELRSEGVIR